MSTRSFHRMSITAMWLVPQQLLSTMTNMVPSGDIRTSAPVNTGPSERSSMTPSLTRERTMPWGATPWYKYCPSAETAVGTQPTNGECIRSEEHTSELQSQSNLVCRLLLEKKKIHRVQHSQPAYADQLVAS